MRAPRLQHYFDIHVDFDIQIESRDYRYATPAVTARIQRGAKVADGEYYFRTTPVFEVAQGLYPELTRHVFVGVGVRWPREALLRVFAML